MGGLWQCIVATPAPVFSGSVAARFLHHALEVCDDGCEVFVSGIEGGGARLPELVVDRLHTSGQILDLISSMDSFDWGDFHIAPDDRLRFDETFRDDAPYREMIAHSTMLVRFVDGGHCYYYGTSLGRGRALHRTLVEEFERVEFSAGEPLQFPD